MLCALLAFNALMMKGEGWVRINQLGYLPQATKVAVLMSDQPTTVDSFQLINAFTGKVAYTSNQVQAMGAMGNMKATFRLRFSAFTQPGTY